MSKKSTVKDVKEAIGVSKRKFADLNRQELRQTPTGKALKDEMTLEELGLNTGAMLYFKDRGLQIGWSTVFLCEYAGPLAVYMWIYTRPWLFYGDISPAQATGIIWFFSVQELTVEGQRWVWDVAFSADSQYMFTASSDGVARLWSITNKPEVKRTYKENGHTKAVTCLAFRDGTLLVK